MRIKTCWQDLIQSEIAFAMNGKISCLPESMLGGTAGDGPLGGRACRKISEHREMVLVECTATIMFLPQLLTQFIPWLMPRFSRLELCRSRPEKERVLNTIRWRRVPCLLVYCSPLKERSRGV